MQFKQLILATTGFCVLSFIPFTALAQHGELTAVYQAYVKAQDSGDAQAQATAEANLRAACQAADLGTFDDCVVVASGATTGPPATDGDDGSSEMPAQPAAEGQQPANEPPPAEMPVSVP